MRQSDPLSRARVRAKTARGSSTLTSTLVVWSGSMVVLGVGMNAPQVGMDAAEECRTEDHLEIGATSRDETDGRGTEHSRSAARRSRSGVKSIEVGQPASGSNVTVTQLVAVKSVHKPRSAIRSVTTTHRTGSSPCRRRLNQAMKRRRR